jgi:hypothetical protein
MEPEGRNDMNERTTTAVVGTEVLPDNEEPHGDAEPTGMADQEDVVEDHIVRSVN